MVLYKWLATLLALVVAAGAAAAGGGAGGVGGGESPLPRGPEPAPVRAWYLPDAVHEFVWHNWELVPSERIAKVLGTDAATVEKVGRSMGLPPKPAVSEDRFRRSTTCLIRRNWHLLPYPQLLELLGWDEEKLAYTLREDDFLWIKLGNLKPKCEPVRYGPADDATRIRASAIAGILAKELGEAMAQPGEPRFAFLDELARRDGGTEAASGSAPRARISPRYLYSFFAPYGDPLMEPELDPYPEGYLEKLARLGVDGVWLQGVLRNLAPSSEFPEFGRGAEVRLRNLRILAQRARRFGIGIYLYLNEPRAMPEPFFAAHPDVRGVREGEYSAMCTSAETVRRWIRDSLAHVFSQVPELAGAFTISASENLTNCYSHGQGKSCPQCGKRGCSDVIAEVNATIAEGVHKGNPRAEMIAWDWGWPDGEAEAIIAKLPADVALMSVSEWSIPIRRGGVDVAVGEYSISVVGPGPRATKHWAAAKKRGMRTLAKVQCNVTWELSTVPFIPALTNVATHFGNLRDASIDGLMLSWTLGGYPSPNLEIAKELALGARDATPEDVLRRIAARRYGADGADLAVRAWGAMSRAFSEYPFHGGLIYNAPVQHGPANPLYVEPTNYGATMTGIPYDDLDGWRGPYPPEVMAGQFEKIAQGWREGVKLFEILAEQVREDKRAVASFDRDVAEACGLTFRSVANQVRFVLARRGKNLDAMEAIARDDLDAARRFFALARRHSVLGFEAANQYFYVPLDLAEKVVCCRAIIDQWIPARRAEAAK